MSRVGIYLDYRRGDSCRVACRLADAFLASGRDVAMGSIDVRRLDPRFDRLVTPLDSLESVRRWAGGVSAVVFADPPDDEILSATAGADRRLVALACMDWAVETVAPAVAACSAAVCPTPRTAAHWRNHLGARKSTCVPWASLAPPLTRATSQGPPAVLFPLCDGQPYRCHAGSHLGILADVLDACDASLTVLWESGRYPPSYHAALRRLRRRHPGRVAVDRRRPGKFWPDYPSVCAAHDLVYWPAEFEGFGLHALDALAAGTPVVCHDAWPMREYVSASHGEGVYLPAQVMVGPGGESVPSRMRRDELVRALTGVLADKGALDRLGTTASCRALARAGDFLNGWKKVLGD